MAKNNQPPNNQITMYQSPDGGVNIEVLYAEENIWLTQKKMAELFDCSSDNISLHLKNIYREKELDQSSTTEYFSAVQTVFRYCPKQTSFCDHRRNRCRNNYQPGKQ